MGHQVIKLQNPLKTLGFLQFYRFKTVKDRIIIRHHPKVNAMQYTIIFTDKNSRQTCPSGGCKIVS